MAIGVIGRKCGMTRVFTEEGISVPVTVIEVTPNRLPAQGRRIRWLPGRASNGR